MKLSDSEFLKILRENAGIFARTSKAIEKKFGIKYSRQAVRERALKHPDELKDIEEENLDVAESGLHSLMRSKDERIKLKACLDYLKTKGRNRGYYEKSVNVNQNIAYTKEDFENKYGTPKTIQEEEYKSRL